MPLIAEYDKEGFLLYLDDWNTDIANAIASTEKITLSDEHWEIIYLARQYQQAFDHSPEMRPLVSYTKQQLGSDKGNSLYLLTLFPNSPAKLVSKIAGLPRPTNCL